MNSERPTRVASSWCGGLPPARVLILRALQLGDLLCAVPAFRAFRAAWPEAEIVLVGLPWAAAFVERYAAYLDGFREFPGYPGLPERPPRIERVPEFLREIQREQFDLAVQLHGSGPFVNSLTALFGARRCAGFYLPGDYRPDAEWFMPYPDHGKEIHRLLELVGFLGVPSMGDELDFPLRKSDHTALAAIDGAAGLAPGRYVCVHPGASVPERRWPTERFAAAAQILAARGYRIVLTGTARERGLTRQVADALAVPSWDFAGRTNLGTLAALLRGARLLLCNDTGVSHLAAALRAPSVVISTGNNPERWAPLDGRRHRVLCQPEGVSVAEVIDAITEVLNAHSPVPDKASGVRPLCDPCVS